MGAAVIFKAAKRFVNEENFCNRRPNTARCRARLSQQPSCYRAAIGRANALAPSVFLTEFENQVIATHFAEKSRIARQTRTSTTPANAAP